MNTSVLFLIFNRPDETRRVFEEIRKAKPPRLYIGADGPREDREGEAELVKSAREIVTTVDWSCEVKVLFQKNNVGNKKAISEAITWFFNHEEEGIVLEDDCLPHQDFFEFCENLLVYYRADERVSMITGNNYQAGQIRGTDSYYFSTYNVTWGWASWRRVWKDYDVNVKFWPTWKHSTDWKKKFPDFFERKYWERIFDKMFYKQIDTWDYSWHASVWRYGGLTATPNVNLVSNIGFGPNATNFKSINNPLARIPTSGLKKITHPKIIVQNQIADRFLFDNLYFGKFKTFPLNLIVTIYRFIKKLLI